MRGPPPRPGPPPAEHGARRRLAAAAPTLWALAAAAALPRSAWAAEAPAGPSAHAASKARVEHGEGVPFFDERFGCREDGQAWSTYRELVQYSRLRIFDPVEGPELAGALAYSLAERTANLTEVLQCNVGIIAGYHLLARHYVAAGDDWKAYALLQLALIWVFTLRNANRVPTEAALEWFTRSDHLVHEIKALRRRALRERARGAAALPAAAPELRVPGLRVGVVSICAYPPDHPLELKSLTPANRKLYAERHGYGLHVHRQHPMPGQGVHIQHAKLALMARYLRSGEYDWVAWFDCDSILMTPEKTLDSIIYQFAGGAPAEPVPEGAGPPPWHVALVDGGLSGEPAGGGADEACAAAAADTPDAPRPPLGPVGAPGRNQTVVGFLLHEGSCNTDEGCRAVSRVRVHPGVSYRVRVSTALVDMEDDSEKLASISVGGRALGECNPSPESDYACGFFDCFAEELVPGDATAGGEVTVEAHAVRTHDDCLCSREEGLCYNRAVAALLEARGLEPPGTSCGMFLKLTFTPEPERREPAPAGPPPPPPPPRGEAAERAPDGEPVVGWVAHAGSCNTAGGCRATAWVRVDPRAQYVAAVSTALIDMEDETEKLASVAVGGRELGECNPAPASDFDCGLAECFQGEAVPSEAVRGGWVLLEAHAVRTNDDCACGDGACHAAPLADMYRAMGENASEQSYGMYVRFTLTPVGPTGALPAGPSAAAVGAAAAVGSPGRAGGRGEPLPDEVVEAYVGHVGSCNTDEGCRESATVRLNRQVAYRVHVSAAMVDMAEDSEMLPAVSVGGFDLGECNPPAADDFDCGYWDCFQDVELPTEITAAGTVTLEAHSVKTSNDCHCNRLHGHCYSAIGAAVGEAVGEELTTDPRYGMFVRFTFTPAAPETLAAAAADCRCAAAGALPAWAALRHRGAECAGADVLLGVDLPLEACLARCLEVDGCRLVAAGTGQKAGLCFWNLGGCAEVEEDEYDLYHVDAAVAASCAMPCSQGGEASAAGDPPGAAATAATDALEPGGAGPGVDLLITEEGWGLSSANWLVRRSAWSIGFLERAFRLCHEEMPLFGDQDAMIHLLLNEGALASAGGDALHPRAAVIPQREINAYDALNAFYMEADAYEEGDLLVTFPGCKEASACNPLFRLAAERAERRAHGEPEPPPEEQQSWAHTRLFGPPQAAAEVYELARQAQRVA